MKKLPALSLPHSLPFYLHNKKNAQNPLTATLLQPATYGGCIDTVFTFKDTATVAHPLKIKIAFAGQDTNCAQGNHRLYAFHITNMSSNVSIINIDTANGVMNFEVDTGATTIQYKILVDCSICP
nr:hypothetical protein [Bacteroidota bacterium]